MDSDSLITLGILIIIFYLCREVNCWYFKINTRKEQMDKILENQKEIIELLKKKNTEESKDIENPETELNNEN